MSLTCLFGPLTATNNGQATSIQVYPRPSNTAPAATPGNAQALAQCKPCGNTDCSFTPSVSLLAFQSYPPLSSRILLQGASSPATYSVLIGQPVANCNSGSQKDTTTKFGGKYELSTSFTVEVSAGINGLGAIGPSFSTTVGKTDEKKVETAQEVEVTIEPGKIGALVANITYSTVPGRMDVGGR